MARKPFIFFLVLLLAIVSAHAKIDVILYTVSDEFTVAMEGSDVNVCSCTSYQDRIIITNVGSFPAIYTVNVDQEGVLVSDRTFELLPGQAKMVSLSIGTRCGQEKDFTMHVLVSSNSGKQKELFRDVHITKCQNILFQANTSVEHVKPCMPITYDVSIQNIGSFSETYSFSTNHDETLKEDIADVQLGPNETAAFPVTFIFGCDISGEQIITFTVQAKNNRLTATSTDTVAIDPSYDYDVSIQQAFQTCLFVDNAVPVTITNPQHYANDYTFTLKQKKATKNGYYVDPARLHLEPFQTQTVMIKVSPADRKDLGLHDMTLDVVSGTGNVKKSFSLRSETKDCYKLAVDVQAKDTTECPGIFSYPVTVRNNGVFAEHVALQLDAPPYAELDRDSFTLQPWSERNVTLTIDTTNVPELAETAIISVNATLDNGFPAGDAFTFILRPESECRKLTLKNDLLRAAYTSKELRLVVKNGPYRQGVYKVTIRGPDWVSTNVSVIQLVERESVTIPLFLAQNESTPPTTYQGVLHLESMDQPISQDIPFSIALAQPSLLVKACRYLVLHPCSIGTLILLILLAALLIVFLSMDKIKMTKKYKRENKHYFRAFFLLAAVFAIGAVLLAVFFVHVPRVYPALPEPLTSLQLVWYENQQKTIDVESFFYSPEHSSLQYTATPVSNIKVDIDETTAMFTPDRDWSGNRTVVFTATDVASARASSAEFELTVVDVPRVSLWTVQQAYCAWSNMVLFMLVILVLCGTLLLSKPKKT